MKKLRVNVRVTELADVSSRIIEIYKKEQELKNDEFLKKLFTELETKVEKMIEAIKRNVAISKLDEADNKRDNAVRALNNVLIGYRSMPIEHLKNKGEQLYQIFSKYGLKIINENYASESALIESLLLDFSAPELEEDITALTGVKESLDELRTRQNEFNKARLDYGLALAEQSNKDKASVMKQPLMELINKKLINYLIAMEMVNPERYKTFSNLVSEIIDSVNLTIKRRNKEEHKENLMSHQ